MKLTTEQLKDMGYVESRPGIYTRPQGGNIKMAEFILAKPSPNTPVNDGVIRHQRIRQSSKPLMNKLEQEWFDYLCGRFPNFPRPRAQAVRLKIGNGAWYKGDVFAASWPQDIGPAMPTIWECKGPKEMKNIDRGILAIKAAATQWSEIRFILVWKLSDGRWNQQIVLP